MEKNYTLNNLIQFIYRDTSVTEHFEMQDAIENNADLKSDYNFLYKAYKSLPKVTFRPSNSSINAILRHSNNQPIGAYC